MLCPDKSILWRWRFDSHFETKRIFVYCKFYRLVTSRPLGERNEPFLAAKRPTTSDEVPRHMKSDEGLFSKSTNFTAASIAETFPHGLDSSRSAKPIAGWVNCSGPIISLRRFDENNVPFKSYMAFSFYEVVRVPFKHSELQPSCIVKLLYYSFLQSCGACFKENKVNFTNLVICFVC